MPYLSFLAWLVLFAFSVQPANAKIGVVLMDSIPGTAGFISQGGHAALYLSETCTDDFLTLRPCTSDDPVWGVVAERTATFSKKAKYDWLALPAPLSLYALENKGHAPLIVNERIRKTLIEHFYFRDPRIRNLVVGSDPDYEKGMRTSKGFRIPVGRWQNLFGSQLRRSIHVVWINDLSGKQERELVRVINGLPNRPKFNTFLFLFAGNCSKWVKGSLEQLDDFKNSDFGNNISADAFLISPKGVTEEAFNSAKKMMVANPNISVTVELFSQTPGTYAKSSPTLFVFENAFENKLIWPVLVYFHPVTFLIGKIYFGLIKGFSIKKVYETYFSVEASQLLVRSQSSKSARKKQIEALRAAYFGSPVWWKEKKTEFDDILKWAQQSGLISSARSVKKGALLKHLLDNRGEIEIDREGALWLVRKENRNQTIKTGLSLDNVDQGNLKLGFRILAARIQYQFQQKNPERRIPKRDFEPEWDKFTRIIRLLEKNDLASS